MNRGQLLIGCVILFSMVITIPVYGVTNKKVITFGVFIGDLQLVRTNSCGTEGLSVDQKTVLLAGTFSSQEIAIEKQRIQEVYHLQQVTFLGKPTARISSDELLSVSITWMNISYLLNLSIAVSDHQTPETHLRLVKRDAVITDTTLLIQDGKTVILGSKLDGTQMIIFSLKIQSDASSSQLTLPADLERPIVIKKAVPPYPPALRPKKLQGACIFQALIGTDGSVQELLFIKRTLTQLDEVARDAVVDWKFIPGRIKGQAQPLYETIQITFKLE